jgi:hypothetical protein
MAFADMWAPVAAFPPTFLSARSRLPPRRLRRPSPSPAIPGSPQPLRRRPSRVSRAIRDHPATAMPAGFGPGHAIISEAAPPTSNSDSESLHVPLTPPCGRSSTSFPGWRTRSEGPHPCCRDILGTLGTNCAAITSCSGRRHGYLLPVWFGLRCGHPWGDRTTLMLCEGVIGGNPTGTIGIPHRSWELRRTRTLPRPASVMLRFMVSFTS